MILNVYCQFYQKYNIKSEDIFRDIVALIPSGFNHTYITRRFFFPLDEKDRDRVSSEGIFVFPKDDSKQEHTAIDEIVFSFEGIDGCDFEDTVSYVLSLFQGNATSYELSEKVYISSPK